MQDYQASARLHTPAERRAHLMRELLEVVLFVGIVFLISHFAINAYRVGGGNMAPQLVADQIIVVNRTSYIFSGPSRGDVVAYTNPENTTSQVIGRVIAVPGDTIAINATQVLVNGVALNEAYVQQITGAAEPLVVATVKISQNDYYVLNDARLAQDKVGHFQDSRSFGPIARSNILGRAVIVFWPLSNFGGVSTFSNVFKNVP